MPITLRELKGFEALRQIFPLIRQLNPDIEEVAFLTRLRAMIPDGYRCVAAFSDAGAMLGCAGFWSGTRFWCGSFIEPDNVVVDATHRSQGVGATLVQWRRWNDGNLLGWVQWTSDRGAPPRGTQGNRNHLLDRRSVR